MKKVFAVLMTLCLALCLVPMAAFAEDAAPVPETYGDLNNADGLVQVIYNPGEGAWADGAEGNKELKLLRWLDPIEEFYGAADLIAPEGKVFSHWQGSIAGHNFGPCEPAGNFIVLDVLNGIYNMKTFVTAVYVDAEPEPTAEPTAEPTVEPTEKPVEPTAEPTEKPVEPTAEPTEKPVEPTAEPTEKPVEPTVAPTNKPEPKPEPKPEAKPEPKPVPTAQPVAATLPQTHGTNWVPAIALAVAGLALISFGLVSKKRSHN